jgi:HD superfamily phosphohydrolase/adenine-specific DNA methylase
MQYVPSQLDRGKLERWIDNLGLKAIRTSDCVQRLKSVCLLGTMQYVVRLRHDYSRYDHSLGVAYLANHYAEAWDLSEEARINVVLISLLHDIGHLPFSHGSEVFYRSLWGQYHTGHGAQLVRHLIRLLHLKGHRAEAEKVSAVAHHIADSGSHRNRGNREEELIEEIFHGLLSADTLDGITRAAESTGVPMPDACSLINSSFRNEGGTFVAADAKEIVEQFFETKHRIYRDFIYCSRGLAAEAMLTRALQLAFRGIVSAGEFLALDDGDALDRLRGHADARWILENMEANRLFCSLEDVQADKYALVVDVCERLWKLAGKSLNWRSPLEKMFAMQMGVDREDMFVIHPTIRLRFDRRRTWQPSLFKMPFRLKDIAGRYATPKGFGETIGVLFPEEWASRSRFLTAPDVEQIRNAAIEEPMGSQRSEQLEKHTGAYMTPPVIANVMAKWAVRTAHDRVLDPASGEGGVLLAAYERLRSLGANHLSATSGVLGIESSASLYRDSISSWPSDATCANPRVHNADFFELYGKDGAFLERFDVVIGNPPYIRANRQSLESVTLAQKLAGDAGVTLSKLANSWAAYVVCAAQLLTPGGRLAMVLPVELLSTDYARPVREFLERRFKSLCFVLFEKAVFATIQQDVLLLLASDDEPRGFKRVEVHDPKDLTTAGISEATAMPYANEWLSGKWTHLLSSTAIVSILGALRESGRVCELNDVANIRLGQVTGNNSFFLLDRRTIDTYRIHSKWLVPMVGKAAAIEGAVFTKTDHLRQESAGIKCFALAIPSSASIAREPGLQAYLDQGRRNGCDNRLKCRSRWPWYSVPMQPPPDAFLTYMSGDRVRLVLNHAKANSTNTIHNVVFRGQPTGLSRKAIVSSFYSSLTALSAELFGRVYGGGVLKLELEETRRLLLPRIAKLEDAASVLAGMFDRLNKSLRSGDESIFGELDNMVLRTIIRLSQRDAEDLANERMRLSTRRMTRLR